MSERNYYCICEDNCKFPTMTSEQILAAIAEATGNTPTSVDDAFITKIKEQNANGALSFWVGTQAQFNALSPAPTVGYSVIRIDSDGKAYICKDDSYLSSVAESAQDAKTIAQNAAAAVDDKQNKDGIFSSGAKTSSYKVDDGSTADATPQFRNIIISDSDPTDLSELLIGDLIFVKE